MSSRRVAVVVLIGVVLGLGIDGSTGSASADQTETSLRWAVVFQHVDPQRGDVSGLDILRSGNRRASPLTNFRSGASGSDTGPPLWSPDGRYVAFARSESHWGLYVVDAVGGVSRFLARGDDQALAWSADGTRIAFSRDCPARSSPCRPGIYVASLDRSRLKRIFPTAGVPSWAPDGRRVACRCNSSIYVFDADGADRQRLSTPGDGLVGAPSWSPDGRLIAFGHHCEHGPIGGDVYCDVAVMGRDGSGKRTLVDHHGLRGPFDDAPVWLPDGTLLVVEGGSLHQIVAVDPHSRARRIVYNEVGVGPAPGPGGVFGLLTQSSSSSSWTLVIVDHAGRVLLRHRLPAAAGIDISTGNSPPSLYIG